MAEIAELNDTNFAETIENGMTMVDFWAPWCAPCMMQSPIMEEVAQKVGDKATIASLNVDEAPKTASQLEIRAIPTLILFKNGKVAKTFNGVTQEEPLVSAIETAE